MGAVAAGVWLVGVDGAGAWRDEVATVAVSGRSVEQILSLARHVDAVLAGYYLLVHAVAPDGVTGARVVSVVALAAATVLLLPLCRRAGVPAAGPWAATFMIVSPVAARWAQEARPAALAALAATVATFALTVALDDGRRRCWCWYAGALVLLAHVQLTALLLLPAHAVTVVVRGRAAGRRWAAAAAVAVLATAPLIALGAHQRHAIAWIDRPAVSRLQDLHQNLVGPAPVVAAVAVVAVLALARRSRGGPAGGGVGILALAVPWVVLPPVTLWAGGQFTPLFAERYLAFCLPGIALLAGCGLAALRRTEAVVAVLVVAVLSLPQHLLVRSDAGHVEDTSRLLAVLRAESRAGDAVVFSRQSSRLLAEAFPATFAPLADVTAGTPGAAAGNLAGDPPARPCVTIPDRVRRHERVWVVAEGESAPDLAATVALASVPELAPVTSWRVPPYTLSLYAAGPPATAGAGPSTISAPWAASPVVANPCPRLTTPARAHGVLVGMDSQGRRR